MNLLGFLDFKIPLFVCAFLLLLWSVIMKERLSSPKESNPKNIDKEKIISNLAEEERMILLYLLNHSSKTVPREGLLSAYMQKLKKTTADYNILEAELKKLDLISAVYKQIHLTALGLEIAGMIYKKSTEGH